MMAGIVPLGNLAEIDARERLGRELQICADARNIVGRNDGAQNGREVQDLETRLA